MGWGVQWRRTGRPSLCSGWLRCVVPCLVLCGGLLGMAPAGAHLIAAQKGTLNVVGDAAFLVLSVPVSALRGVDDDADGALSTAELQAHADAVRAQVLVGLQLRGPDGPCPLQLLMVDVAPPDALPAAPASHLTVLGRFALQPGPGPGRADAPQAGSSDGLSLRFDLFGVQPDERQQDLTITRGQQTQWLRFTPTRATQALLPSTFAVLATHVHTGVAHVLGGADHLLFLLVVLSAAWGWRGLLGALTCFTAGHAVTLAACVLGGWSAPPHLVEPAIAATIVGMAAFDAWGRWRGRPAPPPLRLALVFACALVHGLGLAGALSDLALGPAGNGTVLWALAGFNLGIEAAQLAVAALALVLWRRVRRRVGPVVQRHASQLATVAAMAVGGLWLAERVLQAS